MLRKFDFAKKYKSKADVLNVRFLKIWNVFLLVMFCVTIFAVHFFSGNRFKRYLCLATAIWAGNIVHFSFRTLTLATWFTAFRTSFRFVHESLFCVKFLFSGCKYKFTSAIFADKFFILIHLILLGHIIHYAQNYPCSVHIFILHLFSNFGNKKDYYKIYILFTKR